MHVLAQISFFLETALGRFSQCLLLIFRRRPNMAGIFSQPQPWSWSKILGVLPPISNYKIIYGYNFVAPLRREAALQKCFCKATLLKSH